jgi:hypothetical protein
LDGLGTFPLFKRLLHIPIVMSMLHSLAIGTMVLALMPVLAVDILVLRLARTWGHGDPLGLRRPGFVFLTLTFPLFALLVVSSLGAWLLGGLGLDLLPRMHLGSQGDNPFFVLGLLHPLAVFNKTVLLVVGQRHQLFRREVGTLVVLIFLLLDPREELLIPASHVGREEIDQ